jgi:prepilin-type N-terminal cleavage/methylation domain-containing protein
MRSPPSRAAAKCKANGQSADFIDRKFPNQGPILSHQSAISDPDNRAPIADGLGKAVSIFSTSAFTLIEMIVVILIIATLAAALLTATSGAFDRARKVQAKNDLTQLLTAINAFYTEYGQYPVAAQSGADAADYATTTDANAAVVMDVLRVPAAAPVQPLNPRSIVFLNVPVAKNTANPLGGIGTTFRAWYDPWGKAYQFRIDNNYNGLLPNPYSSNAGPLPNLNAGCIAWCLGKDKTGGSGDKNAAPAADDVLSWQ